MENKEAKQSIIKWLEENQSDYTQMSDYIWANPEIFWKEFNSSRYQAEFMEKKGFKITWDIGECNTAFIAEWGKGKPIIGFAGEYDALPGLSQKAQTTKVAGVEGGAGHGCGHHMVGTGAVASAVAIKEWLETSGSTGTVRYYGCPAEEEGAGKAFMARAGAFDDLDAAFNFHPFSINMPMKGSCVGLTAIRFHFYGVTSHAGGTPEKGRSALDAVELMNVGVNYLREHIKDDVRIHYIITEGGKAPNIVPEEAEVFYFIRAPKPDYLEEVTERVRKVAQGAALMTETTFKEFGEDSCSPLLSNHYLADLQHEAMRLIGPIEFTKEEYQFAQEINDQFPGTEADYIDEEIETFMPPPEIKAMLNQYRDQPLVSGNFPAYDERYVVKGSTDVGDLSLVAPVSLLRTACFPTGTPGHSWGNVATGGMSIGHKGMMHAAKIMAVAAVDLYTDPKHLKNVREEFELSTGGRKYKFPMADHAIPPRYEPED